MLCAIRSAVLSEVLCYQKCCAIEDVVYHLRNLKCYFELAALSIMTFSMFLLMALVIFSSLWAIVFFCSVSSGFLSAGAK